MMNGPDFTECSRQSSQIRAIHDPTLTALSKMQCSRATRLEQRRVSDTAYSEVKQFSLVVARLPHIHKNLR
jgi:hypothetical protein